ncbi:hypothetical protein N8587_01405 [Akkermansiaceae bacterium]|nr:hypothetical protein [Akkermansiaceae bacterium]
MKKGIKIGLFSIGGIVLATGLFFGIRAIIKGSRNSGLSSSEKKELERLRNKTNLSIEEKNRLNDLDTTFTPNEGETTQIGACSFPLRVGDSCKKVAQIQLAINQKHNPSALLSSTGGDNTNWACQPSYPGQHSNLTIDGQLGQATAKQLGRFYGLCESTGFLWEKCDCNDMQIGLSQFNSIVSGADVSDSALASAGYNESEYSNFNVPGFGEKYSSPMGDFYKNKYLFTDEYPPQSRLEKSYGMGTSGKSSSFSGGTTDEDDWSGGLNSEGEYITEQDFIDEVP